MGKMLGDSDRNARTEDVITTPDGRIEPVIQPNSVAMLKAGGPLLRIITIHRNKAWCEWLSRVNGEVVDHIYPLECLMTANFNGSSEQAARELAESMGLPTPPNRPTSEQQVAELQAARENHEQTWERQKRRKLEAENDLLKSHLTDLMKRI